MKVNQSFTSIYCCVTRLISPDITARVLSIAYQAQDSRFTNSPKDPRSSGSPELVFSFGFCLFVSLYNPYSGSDSFKNTCGERKGDCSLGLPSTVSF